MDFCVACHEMLLRLFAGHDAARGAWAGAFGARLARVALAAPAAQRKGLVEVLAFEWPLAMFQRLVRALADVADAQVVHLQDGEGMDVAKDEDFWHLVGFLQLLRCANLRPAEVVRFGELVPRGPRVPESHFLLGGIDKCDAQARLSSGFSGEKVARSGGLQGRGRRSGSAGGSTRTRACVRSSACLRSTSRWISKYQKI